MEMNVQLHVLASLPREEPRYLFDKEAKWALEPVWTQWLKKEESLALPWFESRSSSP